MEYLKIGKFVDTHGLKGEIRIISDLNDDKNVFDIGHTLYFGSEHTAFEIKTYRHHKIYEMVALKGINSINDIVSLKGSDVFVNKDDTADDLFETYVGYEVFNKGISIGFVVEVLKGVKYDVIAVSNKRILIPLINVFVKEINKDLKVINTDYML